MNPYAKLSSKHFWKAAVASRNFLEIQELWNPKFKIAKSDKIATSGSCFAQHISKALIKKGYNWYNAEPGLPFLTEIEQRQFNYNIFSFRTGNIYTVSLLRQWLDWAFEVKRHPKNEVWEKDNCWYIDPFRPNVGPNGFISKEELFSSRESTLDAIRRAVLDVNLFVFTLGLTESWIHIEEKYDYPMCPGTIAGTFDEKIHAFHNYNFLSIKTDLLYCIYLIREYNPDIKFLFTISPVPLTATASKQHVLHATTYSKSVLRAVVEEVVNELEFADYFPSYEICTSFPSRGFFYEPNLRNISHAGVDFVMKLFFTSIEGISASRDMATSKITYPEASQTDLMCEERILEDFNYAT